MSNLSGPSTVTDELLPQRSRDQQLSPTAVPRATRQWWQPLRQQQSSWKPVCPSSTGQPIRVVGTALMLRRDGERKKKMLLRQDKLEGACGRKWGILVTSARVTLPTNISCFSPASVLIAAQYQENNRNNRMNKTVGVQYQFLKKI